EAERELVKLRESDPAFAALDARLSAIVKGDQPPQNEAERLALAQRAYDKALYATAARLWGAALANNPKLGDNHQAGQGYNAACAAALAGCGKGKDEPAPDGARRRLRQQALDWLRTDLATYTKLSEKGPPAVRTLVQQQMKHWEEDSDLAGIRDQDALAK